MSNSEFNDYHDQSEAQRDLTKLLAEKRLSQVEDIKVIIKHPVAPELHFNLTEQIKEQSKLIDPNNSITNIISGYLHLSKDLFYVEFNSDSNKYMTIHLDSSVSPGIFFNAKEDKKVQALIDENYLKDMAIIIRPQISMNIKDIRKNNLETTQDNPKNKI